MKIYFSFRGIIFFVRPLKYAKFHRDNTRVVWPHVTNILDLRYFCQHNRLFYLLNLISCHYWSWKINIYFFLDDIFVRHTSPMSNSSIKTKTVLTMTDVTESTELQASSFKSKMSISFWNENPNKLIQKWLVSNKLYSGIMWQPVWTRSWTKLIPISCKRPLKVFIPWASRFALLSEYYKFQ